MEITDVAEVFQKELWISTASQEILDPLFFSQVNENLADRLKRAGLVLKNVIFFRIHAPISFTFLAGGSTSQILITIV